MKHLYGLPGAEYLDNDLEGVWDRWRDRLEDGMDVCTVEEWSVHPPRHHLPGVDTVLDFIEEWACENGEVGEDYQTVCEQVYADPEVKAATERLLDFVASRITYSMADRHIGTWTATYVGDEYPQWKKVEK